MNVTGLRHKHENKDHRHFLISFKQNINIIWRNWKSCYMGVWYVAGVLKVYIQRSESELSSTSKGPK